MKRVLVTGGSGYIGRHLVTALVGAGVSVRATIRAQASGQTLAALGAEVVPWSMEDATFPYDCLTGIDTCFHLVAPRRTFDQVTQSTRRPGDPVLAQGSERLAAAIAATDVERLIVTSSATVYGKCWGEVDEATPVKPEGLYSHTLAARPRCFAERRLPRRRGNLSLRG